MNVQVIRTLGVLVSLLAFCAQAEIAAHVDITDTIKKADLVVVGGVIGSRVVVEPSGSNSLYLTLLVDRGFVGAQAHVGNTVEIKISPAPIGSAVTLKGRYGIASLKRAEGNVLLPVNPDQILLPAIKQSGPERNDKDVLAAIAFEFANVLTVKDSSLLNEFPTRSIPVVEAGKFTLGEIESSFRQVIEQLRMIPAKYSIPALKRITQGSHTNLAKSWAVVGLLHANDISGLPLVIPALATISESNGIGHPTVTALASAIYSVQVQTPKEKQLLLESLHQLMASNDVSVRRAAAAAARANPTENSILLYSKAINDSDPSVRYFGSYGLAVATELQPAYAMDEYYKHEEALLRFWSQWVKNNVTPSKN